MTTYCRDQAREELTLMMGGGATHYHKGKTS
ncbi:hypothetical protein NIES4071_105090 (plasmid) [Calothrix sp. NIES-4071]|nr:hypothetical protein NIES4071_105090 [Calothrix sp. NIES-4071]BAZ64927.1 hypothetical protein NIES4105_106600 [Calothrix sp. NIES-4105]